MPEQSIMNQQLLQDPKQAAALHCLNALELCRIRCTNGRNAVPCQDEKGLHKDAANAATLNWMELLLVLDCPWYGSC